jgi:hypothetical protein
MSILNVHVHAEHGLDMGMDTGRDMDMVMDMDKDTDIYKEMDMRQPAVAASWIWGALLMSLVTNLLIFC